MIPGAMSDSGTETGANSLAIATRKRLQEARRALLDLGKSNRLISFKSQSRLVLPIVDEKPVEVFSILVEQSKRMRFLPSKPAAGTAAHDEEDMEDELDPGRHTDTYLQTKSGPSTLKNKLLFLSREAQNALDEQGAHLLFLAAGFLEWRPEEKSRETLRSPLALIPINLTRKTARSGFQALYNGDDVEPNTCLQTKLQEEFGFEFPGEQRLETREDLEAYFQDFADQCAELEGWKVTDDVAIGLFTYTKFLMYRDLDPAQWRDNQPLDSHPNLQRTLGGSGWPERDESETQPFDPTHAYQVMDADASQREVIDAAKRGWDLVVQGPPGAGKSQTITNIIAELMGQGKRVLFVSEKVAALDVVRERLQRVGLGPYLLELHSRNANKRAFLDSLESALGAPTPRPRSAAGAERDYRSSLTSLDAYGEALLGPIGSSGFSTYQAIEAFETVSEKVHPGLRFDTPETWTQEQFLDLRDATRRLAATLRTVGTPNRHALRDVNATEINADRIREGAHALESIRTVAPRARRNARALAATLGIDIQSELGAIDQLVAFADWLANAPEPRERAATELRFDIPREDPLNAVEALEAMQSMLPRLTEEFLTRDIPLSDFRPLVDTLRGFEESRTRIFHRSYREAARAIRDWLVRPKPAPFQRILESALFLERAQEAREAWERWREAAANTLGSWWKDRETDPTQAREQLRWIEEGKKWIAQGYGTEAQIRRAITASGSLAVRPLRDALCADLEEWKSATETLALAWDAPRWRWAAMQADDTLHLIEACVAMSEETDVAWDWVAYRKAYAALEEAPAKAVLPLVATGELNEDNLEPALLAAYFSGLIEAAFRQSESLQGFHRPTLEKAIHGFRQADKELIAHARERLAQFLSDRAPRPLDGLTGAGSELGILQREFHKKRRIKPIRRLLDEAGAMVQRIKPVFLMSPLSIAQFLPPGRVQFDTVVFDEASQVRPEDALGAIARADQLIVVGDSRQLPPTRFFTRLEADEDLDADEDRLDDLESVLDLVSAAGAPTRWLRWHYRSRHDSLIAISNREFYDERLVLFPSPRPRDAQLGLQFEKIPNAYFETGGSGANPVEAEAIARAVLQHAATHPDRSLGVGAFSLRQQTVILDAIEALRRKNTEAQVEAFFDPEKPEPFFVKNLENIQGDERDVIFLSVCYAKPSPDKPMAMRLGPLNQEGGERRLNVLITRAREQCRVFASIDPEELDLSKTEARGVHALRAFLEFARGDTAVDRRSLAREEENAPGSWGAVLAKELERRGYAVATQVGSGRFRLDLGIYDPKQPGRFALGVELDGSVYQGAPEARERDRLRAEVLEGLGWRLTRLWAVDWRRQRDQEIDRILAATQGAPTGIRAPKARPRKAPVQPSAPTEAPTISVEDLGIPYAPYRGNESKAGKRLVKEIVRLEQPIHESELMGRLKEILEVSRMTQRFQDDQREHIQAAIRDGAILHWDEAPEFFVAKGWTPADLQPRRRNWRRIDAEGISDLEILAAADRLVDLTGEIELSDLVKNASLILGFRSASQKTQDRFYTALTRSALTRIGLTLDHRNRVRRAEDKERFFQEVN